jgi:hypothetical protein
VCNVFISYSYMIYSCYHRYCHRHIWSYLRVVLGCMDRFDLVNMSSQETIGPIAAGLNVELK